MKKGLKVKFWHYFTNIILGFEVKRKSCTSSKRVTTLSPE